jgi:ABC-2 type transport system permease protein
MTSTAGMATATAQAARPARFADTLASEWSKLFSVRSTYIMLALGIVLSIGMTALVSLAVGSTFDDWNAAEQADFEPIMFSLVGIIFGGIVYSVFGVLAVSGEYSSGMIRQTLTATPRRGRVLAAKAVIVAVVLLVFSLITTLGMFLVGQMIYESFDMPTVGLGDADAQRAVLGVGLTGPLFPLIGLSLAFILRSTAGAITAVLAVLWLPEIFGGLLPMWWRENVISLLPGPAMDSVSIGHIVDSATYSDPAIGALITAAWMVIFLGGAWLMLVRRDA